MPCRQRQAVASASYFAVVFAAGCALLVLAIGISGLQQLGGGFYVEPIFQGASLILSVGLAGYAARRRREGRRA